jgi:hypothetical protein
MGIHALARIALAAPRSRAGLADVGGLREWPVCEPATRRPRAKGAGRQGPRKARAELVDEANKVVDEARKSLE